MKLTRNIIQQSQEVDGTSSYQCHLLTLANALQLMTFKHPLALALASPRLPVDFPVVGNLEYALCALFIGVLGQVSTAAL